MSALVIIFIGEVCIVLVLLVVHLIKVREIRELRKKIEACTNSFGDYLSLLDMRNLKLLQESGKLKEKMKEYEDLEKKFIRAQSKT